MPKRRNAAKKIRRDVFVNRRRNEVTFGADASVVVTDEIDTGMNPSLGEPFKWILVGGWVGPANFSDQPDSNMGANDIQFECQLAMGQQTALLNADDAQLLTRLLWSTHKTTEGCYNQIWPQPLPITYPMPVYARELTFMMKAENNAAFNNLNWCWELLYFTAGIKDGELLEHLAHMGTT